MQQEPPPARICPRCNSSMSPGFVSNGLHTADTNRVTENVRGFTCPNCGYQEKTA